MIYLPSSWSTNKERTLAVEKKQNKFDKLVRGVGGDRLIIIIIIIILLQLSDIDHEKKRA